MSSFKSSLIGGIKNLCFFIILVVVLLAPVFNTNAYVSVKGYTKKNGTYVAPYVRSNPNGLKYDNYSYKPSQGLYNSTYGTRGSTWDTPTYITDPSYYIGQSIYNSNNGTAGTSPGYSTLTPTPAIPSCPYMSTYNFTSRSCECVTGYVASGSSCVSGISICQNKMGYGASYNSTTNTCGCLSAYVNDGGKCVTQMSYCDNKIGYMSQYNPLSKQCECMVGYELVGSTCTYKSPYTNYKYSTTANCPVNSTLISGGCYCNTGYTVDPTKKFCTIQVMAGSQEACEKKYGGAAAYNTLTGACGCLTGYSLVNGKCVM
jgi:hypothetical protein